MASDGKYIQEAQETLSLVLELLQFEEGWKLDKEDKELKATIHSTQSFKKIPRKVFRLQVELDFDARNVWKAVTTNFEESHRWNTTVVALKVIKQIDENTLILHQISPEAAGGIVKSRDFVNVIHYCEKHGKFFSVIRSTDFPDMPAQKQYVRGENGPGGMVFEMIPGQENRCKLTWYINAEMKGMLPDKVRDFGLQMVLIDYVKCLIKHLNGQV